jgi:acetyl esterase/lipase
LIISAPSAVHHLKRLFGPLTESERRSQRFSPLCGDHCGLPPALFLAGQLDPVCEDSTEMYKRWQERNGNAEILLVPEAPHGFNRLPTRLAAKTRRYAREWIRRLLVGSAGSP